MSGRGSAPTLAHLLAQWAGEKSDVRGYVFLEDGETESASRTYGELYAQARRVAKALADRGVTRGDRVLLLFPPGLEFVDGFFGALLAGAVPVPAYPPEQARLRRTLSRLRAIAADAEVAAVLTTGQIHDLAPAVLAHAPELRALTWLAVDRLTNDAPEWRIPDLTGDDLAFLQYTSGSTGTPKGVMVSHGNLVSNLAYLCEGFELNDETVSVTWLPSIHDMGLIDGILTPLFNGTLGVVIPPTAFLKKPVRWLKAISKYGGTQSGGPNFGYEYCVRRVTDEQMQGIDLSCWLTAYNGAEPVNADTLRRFAERFAPTGFEPRDFYPCYGLAEATLKVSGGPRHGDPRVVWLDGQALGDDRVEMGQSSDPGTRSMVSSGRVYSDMELVIAHTETFTECTDQQVGEIWLGGPSIAKGYWNRPEVSEETFGAHLDDGRGPYLRTGDLGFVRDGWLYVTGRLKDVIIVRGRNIYPQDIEATAFDVHTSIRPGCGAAFGISQGGTEQVVLVQEVDPRRIDDPATLLPQIRRAIAEQHEVPVAYVVLIAPRTIPKTTSGKIQRRATRELLQRLKLEALAADGPKRQRVAAEVPAEFQRLGESELGARVEAFLNARLTVAGAVPEPDQQLSRSGVELDEALALSDAVGRTFGVALPLATLVSRPTVNGLRDAVVEALLAARPSADAPRPLDPRALEAWLREQVAELVQDDAAHIGVDTPFAELGLDSVGAIQLSSALESHLGRPVPDTLVWQYPNITAVVGFAFEEPAPAAPAEAPVDDDMDGVAIIGIGLRMPGAEDPDGFWHLVHDCREAITEVPPERWSPEAVAQRLGGTIDPDLLRWGGFVDDVEMFAASFFGISAREAERMDPGQRMLLEVCWEALERAHLSPHALRGSKTGVFVGVCHDDYRGIQFTDPEQLDIHVATGNSKGVAASRLSYLFDFRGPSFSIDTACSSSLVSVHHAVRSLVEGECDLALAGGVNHLLTPDMTVAMARAGMLSPDGRCKTLDAAADGYVRSEGAGLVVLKRLSDARRDGDRVVAVIRGTAVNHGGRTNGLTAPSHEGQVSVIRGALDAAGLAGSDVQLVELHGTGTALGDPIETRALAAALGERPARTVVSSLKANVGHLEGTAGIAGLIKVALALHHRTLPPHRTPASMNPRIDCNALGIEILAAPRAWPRPASGPRVGGVSSFGFGGVNAHVVLSEPPATPRPARGVDRPEHLLCLSARSASELARRVESFVDGVPAAARLGDVCYTANARRAHHRHRLAVVGQSLGEVVAALRQNGEDVVRREAESRAPRVVFQFTGQGSQLPSMGRKLYETQPTFRRAFDACDALARPQLGVSLVELVAEVGQRIHDTRFAQPALFALEWSLAEMWRSWGVEPAAVVGHSLGEFAAACVAGVLTLEEAIGLVVERGRLMADLPGKGSMVLCRGARSAVERVIAGTAVSIAALNGPDNTVITGPGAAVRKVSEALVRAGLTCRELTVSHAFHSAEMDPILDPFQKFAARIEARRPTIPFFSSVDGCRLDAGSIIDAVYWTRHIRQPVRYEQAITAAGAAGYDIFLEIGPRPVLTSLGRATVAPEHPSVVWLPSMSSSGRGWPMLLQSLGQLYLHGTEIDWEGVDGDYPRQLVDLPTHPFERQRYWRVPGPTPALSGTVPRASSGLPHAPRVPPAAASATEGGPVGIDAIVSLFRQQADVLQRLAGTAPAAAYTAPAAYAAPAPQHMAPAYAAPVHAPPHAAQPAPAAVQRPAAPQRSRADVESAVKATVARVSGFDAHQVQLADHLTSELGFDSLMLNELTKQLRTAFPSSGFDPATLGADPTVRSIVDGLATVTRSAAPSAPPAPAPRPTATPRPAAATAAPEKARRQYTLEEIQFENWPEVKEIHERLRGAVGDKQNPYGRVHYGMNAGTTIVNEIETINYASFNYLALSADPQVCAAAQAAIAKYGTSASATPLLLGETPLHHELEAEIADFLGTEASIVFASGHQTNVATLGHLVGPEDLVIHDQYIHDSSIRGAMLAGATRRSFPHNDAEALDKMLGRMRWNYRRVIICLEGAYSQDGDLCDLPAFIEVKKKHDAMLMIDEAHSIGVLGATGAGIGEHWGVDRDDVDLWMGTLSKALGSCGGYIAAKRSIIEFMKFTTPLFIFSTGISPANTAAALEAIRVCRREPQRVARVRRLSVMFGEMARSRGLNTGLAEGSAIVPIIVGSWERAIVLSNRLLARGINAMPIGYPAVPHDEARLRFFLCSDHTEAQLTRTIDILVEVMNEDQPGSARPAEGIQWAPGVDGAAAGAANTAERLAHGVRQAITQFGGSLGGSLGSLADVGATLRRRLNRVSGREK